MKTSLFERLGGTRGITKLNNPAVCKRFLPYREQPERLATVKQHTVDFFSAGSGGEVTYNGRDMVTTHRGMNISPAEYMHVIDDILLSMEKHGIDQESRNEVLGILWSLKGMVIEQ